MRAALAFLGLTICAGLIPAQRLLIVSEFQRVGPDGATFAADRVATPREIISPAVARNQWTTFRVVVEAPEETYYTLYVGQNPDDTVAVKCYQERYQKAGGEWVADELTPIDLPHQAKLGKGQKAQTYLLDLFVPAGTPVERFRFEVQMNIGDLWIITPMEMRPRPALAIAPETGAAARLSRVEERADAGVAALARAYLCEGKILTPPAAAAPTLRHLLLRNAARDLTIARAVAKVEGEANVHAQLLRAAGIEDKAAWCAAPRSAPRGVQWWHRARDFLYQRLPLR